MTDNTHNPLLVIGSVLVLVIAWLIIIVYRLVSPFIPYRPTEAQKMAFLEALEVRR